jgi:hypothetical protein
MPTGPENDAERESILKAVGSGITSFATVEVALNNLFAAMMHPAESERSAEVLTAARHIETKLRIVTALGKVYPWKDGDKARFSNLVNRVKNRADFRHKLAHWMVVFHGGKIDEATFKLLPSSAMTVGHPTEAITATQATEFSTRCMQLMRDIFEFAAELRASAGDNQPRNVGK